jgi:hypothetical protein
MFMCIDKNKSNLSNLNDIYRKTYYDSILLKKDLLRKNYIISKITTFYEEI